MISVESQPLVDVTNKILNDLYGNNYEMISLTKNTYRITILYPEIIITNSRDESHTIRELYVSFEIKLDSDKFKFTNTLTGWRGMVTMEEAASNYSHSHLHSGSYLMGQNEFCLGTGPIASMISEFRHKYIPVTDEEFETLFLSFLFQLNSYVKWESIEGTPYIYIRHIIGINRTEDILKTLPLRQWKTQSIPSAFNTPSDEKIIEFIRPIYNDLNIVYMPSSNSFKIQTINISDKKIKDLVNNSQHPLYYLNIRGTFLKNVGLNNYAWFRINNQSSNSYSHDQIVRQAERFILGCGYTMFRGKRVDCELYNPQESSSKSSETTNQYIVNPAVKEIIEKMLNYLYEQDLDKRK